MQPQLHLSIIDTVLTPDELAQPTEDDKQLTLRLADCAVMSELAVVLPPEAALARRPVMLKQSCRNITIFYAAMQAS